MGIFGKVHLNHAEIADYSIVRTAQVPGPDNYFVYSCQFKYEDEYYQTHERWVFVLHRYRDGMPSLMAKAWSAFAAELHCPHVGRTTAWLNFCENHGLNIYEGQD